MKPRLIFPLTILIVLSMCVSSFGAAEEEMPVDDLNILNSTDESEEDGGEKDDEHVPLPDRAAIEVINTSETIAENLDAQDHDRSLTGVLITEDQGEAIVVSIEGSVTVSDSTEWYDHQGATGVGISVSEEGSEVSVTVNGDISSTNTWTAGETGNLDTAGLDAEIGEGAKADITVNGDITARSVILPKEESYTWSAGISVYNSGEMNLTVNGDIHAESDTYGVGLNIHNDTSTAQSMVTVKGDVFADTLAIRASNDAPESHTDIIVDGTIHCGSDGISLEGEHKDNITITAWQVEPNSDDGIFRPFEGEMTPEEAKLTEKAIQYIVRIADGSLPYVTTDARLYKGYHVANEGENVTLEIAVPEGFEIESVYGKPGNQMALTVGALGKFSLQMIRGGGIEISVNLKEIPAVPSQTEPGVNQAVILPEITMAENSESIASLKDRLQQEGLVAVFPEEFLNKLAETELEHYEYLVLQMNHATAFERSISFPLRFNRSFAIGEKAHVLIAVPQGVGFEWLLLEGTGTEDGSLRITLTPGQLRKLSGQTFLVITVY